MGSGVLLGFGLGSSGGGAGTLVHAMAMLCDRPLSKQDVAETAAQIEINKLGIPVGKQNIHAAKVQEFWGANGIHELRGM